MENCKDWFRELILNSNLCNEAGPQIKIQKAIVLTHKMPEYSDKNTYKKIFFAYLGLFSGYRLV